MASETSDRGESMYQNDDSGSHTNQQDSYFASAHHDHSDDDVFSAGQPMDAQNQQPQQVPVPAGESVIRVQVNPGEILELAPPFTPDAHMIAREADGNLAIKVGDVTVILQGFIDANNQAPVVVESSDGKPIDIATVIAQTDPTIDIQTAAGPAAGPQGGQGADNTGAILAQLQGGAGLGGLNAVGAQDATSLSYTNIDNSIIQDRFLAAGVLGTPGFSLTGSMSEPFLRDPIHVYAGEEFAQFMSDYQTVLAGGGGYADYNGTQVGSTPTVDAFLAETTEHITIPNPTGAPATFSSMDFFAGFTVPTSNGEDLQVYTSSSGDTAYLVRPSDQAVIMVFHITDESGGAIHIDALLINRIDHPLNSDPNVPGSDSYGDVLSIEFNTSIPNPELGQGSDVPTIPGPSGHADVTDDVPVAHDVNYTSFFGNDDFTGNEGGDQITAGLSGSYSHHETFTSTEFGSVDEDWLHGNWWQNNQGNKDEDNNPPGSNKDDAHGDDLGRTCVTGYLDIDFGADGPAGAGGNDCIFKPSGDTLFTSSLVDPADPTTTLALDKVPDIGQPFLDANGDKMTSDGHTLVVLEHTTDNGVDHLVVGYIISSNQEGGIQIEGLSGGSGGQCVNVFELDLNTDPDDDHGNSQFQDFKFELFKGIDQEHGTGEPSESNTNLKFDVIGHDDDGDAVHTGINIHVNDDVPTVGDTHYLSFVGGKEVSEITALAALGIGHGSGVTITTDQGYVDEDWLKGGAGNAGEAGNQDKDGNGISNAGQNGDDIGKTKVFGLLDVNFGGDGPTTQQAALSLLGSNVVDQQFKDADGQTFKSQGHDLIVLEASDGHLEVGYKDGGNDVHVFSLDLGTDAGSWNFGGFAFTLQGAMDHPTAGTEDNLNIHFDVTATDADFDTAHAAINIQVDDDEPQISVDYYSQITTGDGTYGSTSGGTYGTYGTTQTSDAGLIDEDFLHNGNHDKDANGNDNHNQHGDKPGALVVTGEIDINYGADGPGGASPLLLAGAEGDVVGAQKDTGAIDPLKTDDGLTVHLHIDPSVSGHQILIGYTNDGDAGSYDEDSHQIFTLDLDTSTGDFTFTLEQALAHPIANTEDNLTLSFGLAAATDKDGDPAAGAIVIKVNDDHPEVAVTYGGIAIDEHVTSLVTVAPTDYGQIDEDWIGGGNQDQDNTIPGSSSDANNGDKPGGASTVGQFKVLWGADGPSDNNYFSFVDDKGVSAEGAKAQAQNEFGAIIDLKTDDGLQVYLHSGPGGHLVGFTNADPDNPGYFDEGTSTKVFTLDFDVNGNWTFTLLEALQHPIVNTEDNLTLLLGISAGTDGDGDQATGTIKIKVNDDAPKAYDDCPDEGVFAGNVITDSTTGSADKVGADGGTITHIKNDLHEVDVDTTGGQTTIASVLGLLTIHDDGSWFYEAKDGAGGSDSFVYTLTDGDGDQSTATLTITISTPDVDTSSGPSTGPTHVPAASYDHTVAVTHSTDEGQHSSTYHITDAVGVAVITGGTGNDLIEVTGTKGGQTLNGGNGDDIIHAGPGHTNLHGGSGDDTLFGGSGADDFYGEAGHDAMSGGGGNDEFHDVDASDLDGTNTLDGIHSIDGGSGHDQVDLGGLSAFGPTQAGRIENVEALDFHGKASGGGGTAVTLTYDAVYSVTQVGGIQQTLQITGDVNGANKDTVHLDSSGGTHMWSFVETKGGFDTYTAAGAHGAVNVQVEHTGAGAIHTDLN